MSTHTEQFRVAIEAAGLAPPDAIIDDGKRHRFATNGRNGEPRANGCDRGSCTSTQDKIMTTTNQVSVSEKQDRVIYRDELKTLANGVCSQTIRRWLKSGKLPAPDVAISLRTKGWRLSTLQAAGIGLV